MLKYQKNVLLKNQTTFHIGGPADWFCEAKNTDELISALKRAKKEKIPYFVLGGGSNVLISDEGFRGLVIKIRNSKFEIKKLRIYAEAGVSLAKLVQMATENSLSGLELATGIPGTLGGAIFGNAGTTDWGVGNLVEKVTLLMPEGKLKTVNQEWLKFGYHTSRFKELPSSKHPIILSAVLKLKKGNREIIKKIIKERLEIRATKIPAGFSAGCIFKNPPSQPAGLLIDQCGLRGKQVGGAKISEIHASFIINDRDATAKDVLRLIKIIKKTVKRKFGIELEEEIDYVGDLKA